MVKRKPKLPPAPTGYELNDLKWAELTLEAPTILKAMSKDVGPEWATVAAGEVVVIVYEDAEAQRAELNRTPLHSTMQRVHRRELQRLERKRDGVFRIVTAALPSKVQAEYPRASPAQVLMRLKEDLREILRAALDAAD